MSKKYLHWCPNGCGKKVFYIHSFRQRGYHCTECNQIVATSTEELKQLLNK